MLTAEETAILEFCEKGAKTIQEVLCGLYKNRSCLDINQRIRQRRLLPAKTALATIIRAIKKQDYMQLLTDDVPEIA